MKELLICFVCVLFIINIAIRSALDYYLCRKLKIVKPSSGHVYLAVFIITWACYYFLITNLKGAVHYLIS